MSEKFSRQYFELCIKLYRRDAKKKQDGAFHLPWYQKKSSMMPESSASGLFAIIGLRHE